jgi:hypothetical protein
LEIFSEALQLLLGTLRRLRQVLQRFERLQLLNYQLLIRALLPFKQQQN